MPSGRSFKPEVVSPITGGVVSPEEFVSTDDTGHPHDESPARSSAQDASASERLDAIGRLAGVMSHDFSNLLTVILGHADMLLDVSRDNPAVRNSVLEIRNAADAGARVTADLLAISQRQQLRPAPMDVNAVVRQMSETVCQIVGDQVDVRFDLCAELPLVEMDVEQYERVLRSIAVHEREVMPEGGRLTIATSVERHHGRVDIVLRASDTAKDRHRSAEPIFTGKKPSRGAGLALTTAYGIIRQSGGSMTVMPLVGRGAVIAIALPSRDARALSPRV